MDIPEARSGPRQLVINLVASHVSYAFVLSASACRWRFGLLHLWGRESFLLSLMVRSRSCGFPARASGRCTTVSGPLLVHWISRSPQSDDDVAGSEVLLFLLMMAALIPVYDGCRRCCGEVEIHATKTSAADRRCATSVDVCLRHAQARASQSCCVLLLSTRGGDVNFQWYNPFFTCSAVWELGQIDSERDEASTGCCIELVLFFSNRYFWRKNVIVRVKRLSLEEFYKKCHYVVMWVFFLLSS